MFILDTLYEDFPTTYETKINEFIVPIMIGVGILIILFIITLIALMKIFKKANRSGIAAYIPFYNLWVLLEIINKPKIYILLLLIPIINLIFYFQVIVALGKAFRKPSLFILGMLLFPLIFIPILGFGSSEYIGINSEAMSGKSVAKDLPVIEESNEDPINKPAQPLQERKKVEMSLGGGVYQKDYQKTLVNIEGKKKVQKPNLADFRVDTSQQQELNTKSQNNGIDLLADVQFIETTPQKATDSGSSQESITTTQDAQMVTNNQESSAFNMPEIGIPAIQQEPNPLENNIENSAQQINTSPINENSHPANDINLQNLLDQNKDVINTTGSTITPATSSSLSNENVPFENAESITSNMMQFGIPIIQQESVPVENSIGNSIMSNSTNPSMIDNETTLNPLTDFSSPQPIEAIKIEEKEIPAMSFPAADSNTAIPPFQSEIPPITNNIPTQPTNNLSGEQSEYITCPHCGAKIKNGSLKCFMCGKPL